MPSQGKYYAGIGSRETPWEIMGTFSEWAFNLYKIGYTLRSGRARGADQAFEYGAAKAAEDDINNSGWNFAEIYLPWPSFEINQATWIVPCLSQPTELAYEFAERYHPRFKYLKQGAKKLIARNTHQVLGPNLEEPEPVDFIICWTPGGKGGGGTGQAIRIAKDYDIPVYDAFDVKSLFNLNRQLFGERVEYY